MSDNLDVSSISFGIQDTIATSSQQLIDSFLEGDAATAKPDEIKDINEPAPTPTPVKKPTAKVAEKTEDTPPAEPEKPFDPLAEIDEEATDDDDDAAKPVVKKPEGDVTEEGEFNAFESFSKELYNLGAFSTDEGEEPTIPKTPEEFLEVFNEQLGKKAETAIDNFLERFGDEHKEAFDAIFVKGVNPREYYQTQNKIQNFQELDLTLEHNQENVIKQALTDLGYDEEDITSELERIKNYGDLEATAQKHHKVLVKKEQAELARLTEQKQAALQQKALEKNQYVNSINTILQDKLKAKDFDGIPINLQLAKEVQDMLTTERWKTSSGEALTDFDKEILDLKRPENYATKAKLAVLLKILKQDPTLSTIKKAGVTKQTNQLFSEVVKQKPKTSVGTQRATSPSWGGL
ncbi:MAG: hypothetical protein WCP46_00605 [Alphaproteobacteria bacterium]